LLRLSIVPFFNFAVYGSKKTPFEETTMKLALTRVAAYFLLDTTLFLTPQLSRAQTASPAGDESIPGWKHWTKQIEDLDSTIIARLP
jgi:hypothetical protein